MVITGKTRELVVTLLQDQWTKTTSRSSIPGYLVFYISYKLELHPGGRLDFDDRFREALLRAEHGLGRFDGFGAVHGFPLPV